MKRVLVITYYWPPAGGGGVQRTAKFCKYLGQFGWAPIILTVQGGHFAAEDKSLMQDVEHVRSIYRAVCWEPHIIYRKLGGEDRHRVQSKPGDKAAGVAKKKLGLIAEYVRLNLFVPDARIGWLPFAVKGGLRAIKQEHASLIYSSAPPYTAHLVGRKLKQATGLPWVADFRDPWIENHVYNTMPRLPLVKCLNRYLERSVLASANRIVCVGSSLRKLLQSKVDHRQLNKFITIPNGYDRTDVGIVGRVQSRFYMSHFGSTYWSRFATGLYSIVKELKDDNPDFRTNFQLRFFGGVEADVEYMLRIMFQNSEIALNDYIAHESALDQLYEPQLLILPINDVSFNEVIITGKLFEYITTGNPILGIGPPQGDAARILEKTGAGRMFHYEDIDGIRNFVKECFVQWKNGTINRGVRLFPEYERRNLTGSLATLFDECVGV